jgi:hypothetical protein
MARSQSSPTLVLTTERNEVGNEQNMTPEQAIRSEALEQATRLVIHSDKQRLRTPPLGSREPAGMLLLGDMSLQLAERLVVWITTGEHK